MDKKKFDNKLYHKQYQIENKERIGKKKKAWYEANREKKNALSKAYYAANRGKRMAQNKAWYEANREKRKALASFWEKANMDKRRAIKAKRRAQKLQATPPWMTKEDFAAIEEWYQIAKDLQWLSEEKLHVDHIIPLQGKDVCGLHIAENLQILPASMNLSKGNKTA